MISLLHSITLALTICFDAFLREYHILIEKKRTSFAQAEQ
jgi:cbb3-type cytochrome oxidase subunit 3